MSLSVKKSFQNQEQKRYITSQRITWGQIFKIHISMLDYKVEHNYSIQEC